MKHWVDYLETLIGAYIMSSIKMHRKHTVLVEVSVEEIERLTEDIAILKMDLKRFTDPPLVARSRLKRLQAEREFIFQQLWEISRTENRAKKELHPS